MIGKCLFFLCLLLFPLQATASTILFLGDSLTSGYGVEARQAYPEIIGARLERDNFDVRIVNGGVSGSTSASAVSRLKWYTRIHPDILFLALGANDGLRGLSTEELQKNLREAIRYARKNSMRVILAGMEVPPNYGENYTGAFRQVYQNLAAEFDVVTIPFLLDGVAGDPEFNLPDGIHPNPQGHRRIADLVYPYIRQTLERAQVIRNQNMTGASN